MATTTRPARLATGTLSPTSARLEYFGISARLYHDHARRVVARFCDEDTGGTYLESRTYDDVDDAFLSFPAAAGQLCDAREDERQARTLASDELDQWCPSAL